MYFIPGPALRGTIPCTGAGLARFHRWIINFPGPVTGAVLASMVRSIDAQTIDVLEDARSIDSLAVARTNVRFGCADDGAIEVARDRVLTETRGSRREISLCLGAPV